MVILTKTATNALSTAYDNLNEVKSDLFDFRVFEQVEEVRDELEKVMGLIERIIDENGVFEGNDDE